MKLHTYIRSNNKPIQQNDKGQGARAPLLGPRATPLADPRGGAPNGDPIFGNFYYYHSGKSEL